MSLERLSRPVRTKKRPAFFEVEPAWKDMWWGMPEFTMLDATPQYQITINFMTAEDVLEFSRVSKIPVTAASDSAWYPPQKKMKPGSFKYDGPKTDSKYPVCIPSKGRWDCQLTGRVLDRMGVSYRFFVEETEGERYSEALGDDKVVVMPFHDLGRGSIPARNFIWEWAREREFKRHWTVDDNIMAFIRCNNNRRIHVHGGAFFRAMEDFVDRFENVAMAGPHHVGFVEDRLDSVARGPFLLNSRVYSCILLDTSLAHRWRGRYNEDTDLSLRLLKDGWCTLLFRALLMQKKPTSVGSADGRGSGGKAMKGGNTSEVYDPGDFRKSFAESLQKQHPDCVDVVWRFGRWHHLVDYSRFRGNSPRLKPGLVKTLCVDDYGMKLVKRNEDDGDGDAD